MCFRDHRPGPLACSLLLPMLFAHAGGTGAAAGHDHSDPGPHDTTTGHGHPGDPDAVDRVIEITARDIAFEPDRLDVRQGETVRFVITNTGNLPHEFVLAPVQQQRRHAEEMRRLSNKGHAGHIHDEPYAITIPPGETTELVWSFSGGEGELQFACHIPGHYQAGMHGTVKITGDDPHATTADPPPRRLPVSRQAGGLDGPARAQPVTD